MDSAAYAALSGNMQPSGTIELDQMRIGTDLNATCAGVLATANLKRVGEYLEGFVEGWKELIILLELHKRTTTSTFGTRDSRGPFHQSDFGFDGTRTVTLGKVKSPRLLWQSTANPMVPFDGVPFLICGRKVLECQYGPKRDARRRKPDDKSPPEEYCKQIGTRISRKRGCPATITVRRIVRFPDHALYPEDMGKGKSDWAIREKKADILFRLKNRLRNGQVQGKERFYVQLPCDEAHLLHPTSGDAACMSQKLHPAIIDKIYELVNAGVEDATEIKERLHGFVQGEFSLGANLDPNNRAYYPTSHDIRNHMYHANQQLHKKKRPSSGGAHLGTGNFSKKRRVMQEDQHLVYENHITQPIALPAGGQEFGDIFKRAGLDMSPSTLMNSRPYGITPPLKQDSLSFPPGLGNPLEIAQSQSGLMIKPEVMIKPDPMFSESYQCEQASQLACAVASDSSAFKSYEAPQHLMPTIGSVIGGATHLIQDYSALDYSLAGYTASAVNYAQEQVAGYYPSPGYLDDTSSYLTTLNTNNYLSSPPLSHNDAFIEQPFNSCAARMSPGCYSKNLGQCTEVIKASMDLI